MRAGENAHRAATHVAESAQSSSVGVLIWLGLVAVGVLAGLLFRRFLEGTDPTLWKDALFWLLGAYGYFLILTLVLGLFFWVSARPHLASERCLASSGQPCSSPSGDFR